MQDDLIKSKNGILYHNVKILDYCDHFKTIPHTTQIGCRYCDYKLSVLSTRTEQRKMWLDNKGNVNDLNTGKDISVNAEITIATVCEHDGTIAERIVHTQPEDVEHCEGVSTFIKHFSY